MVRQTVYRKRYKSKDLVEPLCVIGIEIKNINGKKSDGVVSREAVPGSPGTFGVGTRMNTGYPRSISTVSAQMLFQQFERFGGVSIPNGNIVLNYKSIILVTAENIYNFITELIVSKCSGLLLEGSANDGVICSSINGDFLSCGRCHYFTQRSTEWLLGSL